MGIINFKLPTGLEVSGSTSLTGTLDATGLVNVTTLTASVGVSGTVGNFGTLNAGALNVPSVTLSNNLIVSGNTTLGDGVGTDIVQVNGQLTASNGLNITAGTLNASAVAVSASALNVTNDISARSASLSGDLTVQGKLTVNNMLYVDTTTVNVGDTNINLGTGSSNLTNLDGGGIDLGTGAQVQWRYDNTNTAWTSNVDINLSASKAVKLAGVTALTRAAGANALVNSTNGSVSINNAGVTAVSGNLTASITAPLVSVGSVLTTTASLNAASYVTVGNNSTTLTNVNGVATTLYGTSTAAVVAPLTLISGSTLIQLSGTTAFNGLLGGPTGSFTVLTGSSTTGSLATFTTVSASAMSASTILVNSIGPNFRYESPSAAQTINTLQTGTIDTFSWGVGGYGGAKYVIKAKEQAVTNYCHMVELLVATDGTYALGTPYGSTYTGPTAIMSFDVAINGANVDVKVINNSAQTVEVKWIKDYLTR